MPIPLRLDYVIERVLLDKARLDASALAALAGVRLSTSAAKAAWTQVLEHKWYLSERLGRDVGLRVAAVDFFENIRPLRARRRRLGLRVA